MVIDGFAQTELPNLELLLYQAVSAFKKELAEKEDYNPNEQKYLI